jgi:hypothetical protein
MQQNFRMFQLERTGEPRSAHRTALMITERNSERGSPRSEILAALEKPIRGTGNREQETGSGTGSSGLNGTNRRHLKARRAQRCPIHLRHSPKDQRSAIADQAVLALVSEHKSVGTMEKKAKTPV